MSDIEPITALTSGQWPVLDADTPIFNEVAIDLGLVAVPAESEPDGDEPDQDTGEAAGGEHD